jgi:hypothetical protein
MQKLPLNAAAGIAAAVCFAGLAHAQTLNKCVDANGKTVYTQAACPSGSKASTIKTDPAPQAPAAPSGKAGEKPNPEKDFAKRQKAREEDEKKSASLEEKAKQAQDTCTRARQSLAQLETGRVSQMNEKGEKYFLDDAQLTREKDRAIALIRESCK